MVPKTRAQLFRNECQRRYLTRWLELPTALNVDKAFEEIARIVLSKVKDDDIK